MQMKQKVVAVSFYGIVFLFIGLSQISTSAVLADELINITDIKDCQQIKGDTERLACYDTVSRGGIFNEQKLKEVQVEQFGSENMRKPPEPAQEEAQKPVNSMASGTSAETKSAPPTKAQGSVDEIRVTVVRVKKDGAGYFYFQTSDNQVWKQRNASSWSMEVPFEAKIEKGMMGSFFLVNEGGKSTRVKRVK